MWAVALLACGPRPVEVPVRLVDWPGPVEDGVARTEFPAWAFSMKVWPFDVLETTTTDDAIRRRLDRAADEGADTVIFYVQAEHMYDTFVDDAGFAAALERVRVLVAEAESRDLRTIHYLNGLEVMTRGAYDADCRPTGVPTMATEHPDWLQVDLEGRPIVFACQREAWLEPDWEDAWVSPFSGYRALYADRLREIGAAGVDAVYVDATFLPGFQEDEDALRWGSTDPAFAAAFRDETGLQIPTAADGEDPAWAAFLAFRHEAVADYLGDLADAARSAGMVPFFESSACDTPEGTLLGNETALTPRRGLGVSPEIEPGGDWLAAWRMAKSARDLSQDRPQIYLGWPRGRDAAEIEYATALAVADTYYPTADIEVPRHAFALVDDLAEVFERRRPYGGDLALVYSYRNRDLTWEDEAAFDAYVRAFEALQERHLPFRIRALEHLPEDGLEGVGTVVLPGIRSLTDAEVAALGDRRVVVVGDEPPVGLGPRARFDALEAPLPFRLTVPAEAEVEYAQDVEGEARMWLFLVMEEPRGKVELEARDGEELAVRWWRLGGETGADTRFRVRVPLDARLTVIQVERH